MKRATKDRLQRFFSDNFQLIQIGKTITQGFTGFTPLPEQYPPSFVIVPQRKKPFVRIMKGKEYLKQLKRQQKANIERGI